MRKTAERITAFLLTIALCATSVIFPASAQVGVNGGNIPADTTTVQPPAQNTAAAYDIKNYLSAEPQDLTGKAWFSKYSFFGGNNKNAQNVQTIENTAVFVNFKDSEPYADENARALANLSYNGKENLNSLYAYMNAMSYGKIKINTSFYPQTGEVILPEPLGYYTPKTDENTIGYADKAEKEKREAQMAAYILENVNTEFTAAGKAYDGESISFIFPTCAGVTAGVNKNELLWPHKALFGTADVGEAPALNGEKLAAYNIVAAGNFEIGLMGSTSRTASGIIHEFLHTLGLPDLSYSTNRSSGPVGLWDVTGATALMPAALNAYYQRQYAGFGNPLEVVAEHGKTSVELNFPLYENADEKYAIIVKAPDNTAESFVIEARKQDIGTPSVPNLREGLLTYRINSAFKASAGNKAGSSFLYVLRPGESAFNMGDGKISDALIENGESLGTPIEENGDAGRTLYYADGSNSGIIIDNVAINGDKISFDITVPAPKSETNVPEETTPPESTPPENSTPEETTPPEGTPPEGETTEQTPPANSIPNDNPQTPDTPTDTPEPPADGWSENGESFIKDGEPLKNDIFELEYNGNKYLYAFDENGIRATLPIIIGENEYYPTTENNNALAANAFVEIDGNKRYYAKDAIAVNGWFKLEQDNGNYKAGNYYQSEGFLLVGKHAIEKIEYSFDENGRLIESKSEWSGDKKQFYLVDGEKVISQKRFIDGKYYIFNDKGERMTGEFEFTDPETGIKAKYCAPYEENNYALAQNEFVSFKVELPLIKSIISEYVKYYDENCELKDGAINYIGTQSGYPLGNYYQKDGAILTGRQTIGEDIMFFGANGLRTENGWLGEANEYYVRQGVAVKNGVFDAEWTDKAIYKYAFDEKGIRLTGEFELLGKGYYAPEEKNNFALITKQFLKLNDKIIYFDENGAKPEGWFELAEDLGEYKAGTYYQSGYVFTGAQELVMPDGAKRLCFLDEKGRLVNSDEGWHTMPEGDYYLFADGTFATGIVKIEENLHGFNEKGVLQKDRFEFKDADGTYFYIPNAEKVEEHYPLYTSILLEYFTDGNDKFTVIDEKGRQVKDGWVKIGDKSYYQTEETYRAFRGRKQIGDKFYIFGSDCALADKPGFVTTPIGRYYMTSTDGISVAKGLVDISDNGVNDKYFPGALPTGELYCFDIYGLQYTGRFSMDGYQYVTNINTEFGAVYRNTAIHVCECPKDANGNIVHDGSITAISASGRLIGSGFCFINGRSYYQMREGLWTYKVKKGYAENLEGDNYYFDPVTGGISKGWHVAGDDIRYFSETMLGDKRVGVEVMAPTFKVDNEYNVSNNTRTITIKAQFGYLGAESAAYSFDGGKTWQTSNVANIACASGKSLKPGDILVRGKMPATPLPDELKSQWGERASKRFTTANKDAITLEPVIGSNRGIDVSSYQGVITPADWNKIRGSGISFAIIRGMSWPKGASNYQIDPQFEANVRNAKAAGINVGVYLYSYAFNASEGIEEAEFFGNSAELKRLRNDGIVFDLPVFIDYEDKRNVEYSDYANRTAAVRTAMVHLEQKYRLYPGFYTYEAYMQHFNAAALATEGYPFWYARYPVTPDLSRAPDAYGGAPVAIWQYTSKGSVSGVNGNVDLNIMYDDVVSKTHNFYGTSGTTPKPIEPKITVYDTLSKKNVTGTIEELLPQIVAGEVGGFAGNNTNLYKAQAVAANSWLMAQYANAVQAPHVALKNPSYALKQAVLEVAHFIMQYGGTTANTAYGSANNGVTASAQQMWGGDLPYLKAGVESSYDKTVTTWYGRKNVIANDRMATNLKKLFSEAEVNACDPSKYITSIQKDSNGYVTSVTVLNGTKSVAGGKFYDNMYGLYSPSFDMPRYTGSGWEFTTYGNGHCVGMSQWGAYGMSTQGRLWSDILGHYYPDTQISAG